MNDPIVSTLIVLLIPTIVFVSLNVKLVKEHHQAVIERLGVFHRIVGPGIYMLIPFYERMVETLPTGPIRMTIEKRTVTYQIDDLKTYYRFDQKELKIMLQTLMNACYPSSEGPFSTLLNEDIDPKITSYMHACGLRIIAIDFDNK